MKKQRVCPMAQLAHCGPLSADNPEVVTLINHALNNGCLSRFVNEGQDAQGMLRALVTAFRDAGAPRGVVPQVSAPLRRRPRQRDRPLNVAHNHRLAEKIATALRESGDNGLSRTAIRDATFRNVRAHRIEAALALLRLSGLAVCQTVTGRGHPREIWYATRRSETYRVGTTHVTPDIGPDDSDEGITSGHEKP